MAAWMKRPGKIGRCQTAGSTRKRTTQEKRTASQACNPPSAPGSPQRHRNPASPRQLCPRGSPKWQAYQSPRPNRASFACTQELYYADPSANTLEDNLEAAGHKNRPMRRTSSGVEVLQFSIVWSLFFPPPLLFAQMLVENLRGQATKGETDSSLSFISSAQPTTQQRKQCLVYGPSGQVIRAAGTGLQIIWTGRIDPAWPNVLTKDPLEYRHDEKLGSQLSEQRPEEFLHGK